MENECITSLKSSAASEIPIWPRHWNLDAGENYNLGDCSNIHTLLNCRKDLSVLLKLKMVRVLDLSHAYVDELPASIEHLHHLRYLNLSSTYIRKLLESICMLVNLQTLILYGCYKLSEIPKSITYMNSLRHLLFYDNRPEFEALNTCLSHLQNLKTLSGYTVEDDAKNNIRQLKSLNPLGALALYNLQKVKNADDARKANLDNKQLIHTLKLSWEPDDECCSTENAEEVMEGLKPPSLLNKLTVSYYLGKQFPMWMGERQKFKYLHRIILFKCKACAQLLPLEILPSLENLSISEMHSIKRIVNSTRGNPQQSFPALKKLYLESMRNLEGWCVEEDREASLPLFPCLNWMEIQRCPKLTTLPLEILPCLEYLRMYEMDGIKHIVNNRRAYALQLFPALKNLYFESIRNLEEVPCEGG